jgi:hypothetical protein
MWRYEKEQMEVIEEVFSDELTNFRVRVLRVLTGPNYEMLHNIMAILNVTSIYIKDLDLTNSPKAHAN